MQPLLLSTPLLLGSNGGNARARTLFDINEKPSGGEKSGQEPPWKRWQTPPVLPPAPTELPVETRDRLSNVYEGAERALSEVVCASAADASSSSWIGEDNLLPSGCNQQAAAPARDNDDDDASNEDEQQARAQSVDHVGGVVVGQAHLRTVEIALRECSSSHDKLQWAQQPGRQRRLQPCSLLQPRYAVAEQPEKGTNELALSAACECSMSSNVRRPNCTTCCRRVVPIGSESTSAAAAAPTTVLRPYAAAAQGASSNINIEPGRESRTAAPLSRAKKTNSRTCEIVCDVSDDVKPLRRHLATIVQHEVMSAGPAALMATTASSDAYQFSNGSATPPARNSVGMALTTDERLPEQANNVQQYQGTELMFTSSSQGVPYPEPMTDFLEPNQRPGSIQPAGLGLSAGVEGGGGDAARRNRVFGLSKDLAGPSPDSAYLPPKANGAAGSPNAGKQRPTGGYPAYDQAQASSSKVSLSSPQKTSSSSPSSNGVPHLAQQQPAPASSAQPGASSQFSIEIIAPSFDKRGYPIFSGRAASIRGIVRMKAIRDCQVEIKLGAYISQGAPAAVWDGLALMPPEQGGDHHIFSITETLSLDESMMRTRDGASPDSTSPDDLIFETPFDVNLPLGVSTRFVNGEPTVTAVNLPPSYEVSSEGLARERDLLRGTASVLKSSAASIRSRSSRLTNFASSSSHFSATVRDAVERGLGETYRIGCFYTMEFTLQRLPDASADKPAAARKLFSSSKKAKKAKPIVLDSITVPFIFLGEQSSEQPPPLSIPALFIANAVARPGSFLGDGWQCERASIKWPGRAGRGVRRNVDIEMHMPFPCTLHAPSLFPVLIILRPTDARLLDAVPVDFVPLSPTQTDDASAWGGGGTRSGRTHSRQSTMSKFNSHPPVSGAAGNGTTKKSPSSVGDQETEELQSHEHGGGGNDANSITSSATDGFLSRFMRSSLTLTRKNSSGQLSSAPHATPGLNTSQSNQSIRQAATEAGSSDKSGSSRAPPKAVNSSSGGGSAVTMLRDAVTSKIGSGKRPNTAPPSQSSSDGRTRMSEATTTGIGGQYTGNLSGLVRVSLVQTTFCVSTGPAELPKNLRRLVSMAEVEELDSESLLAMVRQMNGGGDEGRVNEHDLLQQTELEEQLKEKGVRVLRALFRVGSDATPSFRCQGIELRYGIKVDLVPFSVRRKRVNSGGAASASSGGAMGAGSSESGGDGLPKSRSRSSFSSSVDPSTLGTADSAAPPYSPGAQSVGHVSDVQSPVTPHFSSPNPVSPTQQQHTGPPVGQQHLSSPINSTFTVRGGGDAASVTTTGDYASTLRGTFRTRGKAGGSGAGGGVPRSGETAVSTVYADGAQSFNKIEKGVGVLFASVRLVRAAT